MQSAVKSSAILICSAIFGLSTTAAFAIDGAKDLFYKQMSQPTEQINTGVQYWIELRRNGKSSRVSNKFDFQSGDRIKFHVKSNISGFAYVVLKEGSKGEHAVLFPDSKLPDDNRVKAGVDYAIPGDGFLLFDSEPGSEKLMLILSRDTIHPDDWIRTNSTKPRVLVASRQPGAKDLVPGSAVVGFDDSPQIADLPPSSTTLVSSSGGENSNPETHIAARPPITPSSDTNNDTSNGAPLPAAMANVVTTVVEKDPKLVLALDIVLTHKP
jgi:hypothetical protein